MHALLPLVHHDPNSDGAGSIVEIAPMATAATHTLTAAAMHFLCTLPLTSRHARTPWVRCIRKKAPADAMAATYYVGIAVEATVFFHAAWSVHLRERLSLPFGEST